MENTAIMELSILTTQEYKMKRKSANGKTLNYTVVIGNKLSTKAAKNFGRQSKEIMKKGVGN